LELYIRVGKYSNYGLQTKDALIVRKWAPHAQLCDSRTSWFLNYGSLNAC